MRICLISLDFPPYRSSGLTLFAESTARGLAERGHAVTVIAARRAAGAGVESEAATPGVQVQRVSTNSADWIGLGRNAARYLHGRRDQFDVVHFMDVHFAYAYRGAYLASAFQSFHQRLTSDHGQPYHTNWQNHLFRLAYYTAAKYLMEEPGLRRAGHLIMPSQATCREFVTHYGLDPARTSLVYPGIDLRQFGGMPDQVDARRRLKLPLDVPFLLYVGFSTPRKGLEYLADALHGLQGPAQLLMVGKWEARYQERFLARLGPAQNRVRIVGYVPDLEILNYYAAADAFVLPTLLEGFGIPLVEAMAAGLPVVTTTAGSAGEVVGHAGIAVPPGDSAALGQALARILAAPVLRQEMAQAGRERAAEFDLRRAAAETEAVYERYLNRGRP
jgi:glycosyltransferase involved in cell wall biosynthesis